MLNPYSPFCQDFYVNVRLATQLSLPHNRETVLHFFERFARDYPGMNDFRRCDNGDFNLEEDRRNGSYRWLRLESKRLASGYVNPASLEDATRLHAMVLEQAPYQLGISPLEIDYLEVLFGFDLSFRGNHDDIVTESLLTESPLACLLDEPGARPVDVQPSIEVALSDDCRLKARIDVVTRTDAYQVRTGDYNEDEISVFLALRRTWSDRPREGLVPILKQMINRADILASTRVVPKIIRSISSAISSRS